MVAPYLATKHALLSLSESLCLELEATKVSVSAVVPRVVATNIFEDTQVATEADDGRRQMMHQVAQQTAMSPDEAAQVILAQVVEGKFWAPTVPPMFPAVAAERARFLSALDIPRAGDPNKIAQNVAKAHAAQQTQHHISEKAGFAMAQARFDRETTLITGAGSGVGAATVHRYAADVGHPVLLDLNGDAVSALPKEIGGTTIVGDATDADLLAVQAALPAMRANAGGFIVLDSSIGGCWAVPGGCPMRP